jgi:hypothetical protein
MAVPTAIAMAPRRVLVDMLAAPLFCKILLNKNSVLKKIAGGDPAM